MAVPVQIVWSFDTTGSMSSCLQAVRNQIQEMSARLLKDIPGLEIGLIAHGDYCDTHSSYLVKTMPFSKDPKAISGWVAGTGATGGGDAPEAYEIALRAAKRDFAWQPEARKVLALIGDEVPHGPDFHQNTERVDWEKELEALGKLGVRVFGVQCLNNARASFFYKALAERTDGMWLPMNDLQIIRDVFLAVCLQVADTNAFEQFRSQLAESGPVASALVPLMLRLAKKKKLSGEELASLTGVVAKLASAHGRPPTESFLPIDSVEVSAFAKDSFCEVELLQTFTNRADVAGKGASFEYRFAMPTSAAVFHFEAELSSGRRIVGVVKGREEARREYQRALSQGKTAFLMEEQNADIFAMELGNLKPEESVKITLRYIMEPEEISPQTLRVRLPQHVAPRSGGKAVSGVLTCYPITVNVFSEHVQSVRSISYSDHFELLDSTVPDWSTHGRLILKPEDGMLNGDLVFDLELCKPPPPLQVTVEHCEELKSTMMRVALRRSMATSERHPGKHIALVLDASCSMQGNSYLEAKAAARELLRALAEEAEPLCSCLLMRSSTEVLCESLEAATTSAALEASNQLCGGGSDFGQALDAALALTSKPDAIVFISDGQGPERLEPIYQKAQNSTVPIFCMGVGQDPGAELLEGLAAVGGGTVQLIAQGSDIVQAARQVASDLIAEAMDLKVEVNGVEHEQWPTRSFAYPDRVALAYIRFKTTDTKDVSIAVNGEKIPLPSESIAIARRLHRLGARSRILDLERLNVDGTLNSAIAALAVEQGLASSQTSFVAVEEEDSAMPGQPIIDSKEPAEDKVPLMESIDAAPPAGACAGLYAAPPASARCASPSSDCADFYACDSILERGASLGSLRSMSREINSSCYIPECSAMTLECASMSLGERGSMSLSMPRSAGRAMKRKKMAAGKAMETASGELKSVGNAMATAASGMKSRFSNLVSPPRNSSTLGKEKASEIVPAVLALPSGLGCFYKGTLTHEAFGGKAQELVLKLDAEDVVPGRYVGHWYSMNQIEQIFIEFAPDSCAVRIWNFNEDVAGKTELRGFMDKASGKLYGSCLQDGVSGGSFELEPRLDGGRVELTDTDGDKLVFIRLLHGDVAEYCNGKLVLQRITSFKFNACTGDCADDDGTFTVPDGPTSRSSVLRDLKDFLETAGVAVVETSPLV